MCVTLQSNPDSLIWAEDLQKQFISEAYLFYCHNNGHPEYYFNPLQSSTSFIVEPHKKDIELLTWLYRLGFETGWLQLAYDEFERSILFGGIWPVEDNSKPRHKKRWYQKEKASWYKKNGVSFREKKAGAKKVAIKKDITDHERQKGEWRGKKQFNRDRQKNRNWKIGTKRRSFEEKRSSRKFRQLEKHLIREERWDELVDSNSLSRYFRDPWNWD